MKRLVAGTLAIYIISSITLLVLGMTIGKQQQSQSAAKLNELVSTTEQGNGTSTITPIVNAITPSTSTATNIPSTGPTPQPTCGNGGHCTAAQVATHNSQNDCWMSIGSKAYDVTSYIQKHPGGSRAFNAESCGGDITLYMQGSATTGGVGRHNHSQNAYYDLAPYFVANIVN